MKTADGQNHFFFVDPTIQALLLWVIFFSINLLINGTIPFIMGKDLQAWSQSPVKFMLVGFVVYGILFLVVPLWLMKGKNSFFQKAFWIPLCLAMIGLTLSLVVRGINTITILALAYLHWRFDLTEYGIRSRGWIGDLLTILMIGALGLVPVLLRTTPLTFSPFAGLVAALDRLFANPGSSVENLFYFGFLTERLSRKTGRWLTPLLIGLMYVAHEMTNPEYWYEQMNFVMIFFGVAIMAWIYLWRRSVVVIWLGDGLIRFFGKLF